MNRFSQNAIVVGVFLALAFFGVLLSFSAPYALDDDELVYLTGALQAREHTLPDAHMLQAYDYGPYVYPAAMFSVFDSLGYYPYKTILVFLLVLSTGIAGYALFRLLALPWIPALLLSLVAVMPRDAAGTETFGVLTFREATGRSLALPLFLLGSGFLIHRLVRGKSIWWLFGLFGLLIFLHPATILLFAPVAIFGILAVRFLQRTPFVKMVHEVALASVAFIVGGAYFFYVLVSRFSHTVSAQGVSAADFVQAVYFRNQFEFPAASLLWFRHMFVVSSLFIALLIAFYTIPRLKALLARYPLPHAREILVWGLTAAASALLITIAVPGIDLYLMQHADAPYFAQQWSRTAKLYYLGLFVAVTPLIYALWQQYVASTNRWKHLFAALIVLAGVLSSTIPFEMGQFALGYKNYNPAYIPQSLSHVPDRVTPSEYEELCGALKTLGAKPETLIISNDFALRYYCRSDLYATSEEGAAYLQLERADMVTWYKRYIAQRTAIASGDPQAMIAFAKSVGGEFVVMPRDQKHAKVETFRARPVATTTRFTVLKVNP